MKRNTCYYSSFFKGNNENLVPEENSSAWVCPNEAVAYFKNNGQMSYMHPRSLCKVHADIERDQKEFPEYLKSVEISEVEYNYLTNLNEAKRVLDELNIIRIQYQ